MTIKDVNHVVVKLIVAVELMVAVVRVGAKEQEETILLNHIKLCLEIMLCFFKFMQILGRKIQYGRRQSPSKFRSTAEMRNDNFDIGSISKAKECPKDEQFTTYEHNYEILKCALERSDMAFYRFLVRKS